MGIEREKRFLVDCSEFDVPMMLKCKEYLEIVQHYISFDPVVRVRKKVSPEAKAFEEGSHALGIKGPGEEIRPEFEYPISPVDFGDLVKMSRGKIVKRRFFLEHESYKWEIDQFLDYHRGLWLAEVEMSLEHTFKLQSIPPWLGREITGEYQFTNVHLAQQEGEARQRGLVRNEQVHGDEKRSFARGE